MPTHNCPTDPLLNDGVLDDSVLESLADLERNQPEAVTRARSSTRIRIRSTVIARPANSSDRLKFKIQGATGDVSAGGCQVLFPIPLGVGDVYLLTFDKSKVAVDSVFARCLRCRLIREDAYEAGFKFFDPIDVSEAVAGGNRETLFGKSGG